MGQGTTVVAPTQQIHGEKILRQNGDSGRFGPGGPLGVRLGAARRYPTSCVASCIYCADRSIDAPKSASGATSKIRTTWSTSSTSMGDRSSPPIGGMMRLAGAITGSVMEYSKDTSGLPEPCG